MTESTTRHLTIAVAVGVAVGIALALAGKATGFAASAIGAGLILVLGGLVITAASAAGGAPDRLAHLLGPGTTAILAGAVLIGYTVASHDSYEIEQRRFSEQEAFERAKNELRDEVQAEPAKLAERLDALEGRLKKLEAMPSGSTGQPTTGGSGNR